MGACSVVHYIQYIILIMCLTVGGYVDGGGQFLYFDFESLLDFVEGLHVLLAADEGDGEALGAESASSSHSVQVRIRLSRHVKVEDHIDLFDIDSSSEDVSSNHDPVLELLEVIVPLDSIHKSLKS